MCLRLRGFADDARRRRRVNVEIPGLKALSADSALVRLLNELDTWTKYDAADDPLLEHVIARVDPNGAERLAMLHARARILLSRTMRMREAVPVDDWKTPLQTLLAEPLPKASLRLNVVDKRSDNDQRQVALIVCPPMHDIAKALQFRGAPLCLRPADEVVAERAAPILACWRQKDDHGDPAILFETDDERARDPNRWLDLLEVSPACGGVAKRIEDSERNHHWNERQSQFHKWREATLPITKHAWHEADCQLALVWLSLRRALSNDSILLRSGAVLVPLGAGIVAEIWVYRHKPRIPQYKSRASLELTMHYEDTNTNRYGSKVWDWVEQPLTIPVVSHRADTTFSYYNAATPMGPHLPPSIRLEGHDVVAEITFRYSPLFVGSNQGATPGIAAASAAAFATGAAFDDDERQRLS